MEINEVIIHFGVNVIRVIKYAIIGRILFSWFQPNPEGASGKIAKITFDITEPILKPVRRILPRMGMIDFSPLLVFLALDYLHYALLGAL